MTASRALEPLSAVSQPLAAPAPAEVRLENVRKTFGEIVAVAGVDLEVREGEFFSLLGPSGCGKTTCLRMIAGFEEPPGESCCMEKMSPARRLTSATSTPSFRTTRYFRTCRCGRTSNTA